MDSLSDNDVIAGIFAMRVCSESCFSLTGIGILEHNIKPVQRLENLRYKSYLLPHLTHSASCPHFHTKPNPQD